MIIRLCVPVPQGCLEDSGDGRRHWTRCLVRPDLVVPARPSCVGVPFQLGHPRVTDADATGVLAVGADGVRDGRETVQRPALSVATEEAQETMLDWVPTGAAAVNVGHAKAVAVALDTLQRVLPSPRAAAVAADEDQ